MIINNSKLLRVRFTVFFVENERMLETVKERERERERVRALEKVWWNKRRGDDGEMGVKEEANDREVTNELEREGVSVWVRIIREKGEVEYEWKN